MESGSIIVSIPIPVALVIPTGFVIIFALIRGILKVIPL